jgi:hypothetical protein
VKPELAEALARPLAEIDGAHEFVVVLELQ